MFDFEVSVADAFICVRDIDTAEIVVDLVKIDSLSAYWVMVGQSTSKLWEKIHGCYEKIRSFGAAVFGMTYLNAYLTYYCFSV